jgi:signal transduction histidine kinase
MNLKPFYTEAELKTLLDSVTDLVVVGNREGVYRCNKLALTFFNASNPEELNKLLPSLGGIFVIKDLDSGEKLQFEDLPLNRAFTGDEYKIDIILSKEDNKNDHYFHCNGVPIRHEDEVVGAVLILTDFTYEKAANEVIENALNEVDEIKQLNKRLEKFSYAIAHDINSPLNKIQALSHYLLESTQETSDPKIKSFLEIIYSSSFRLTEYVISLLKLSVLKEGALKKEWIPLDSFLKNIIDGLALDKSDNSPNITFQEGMRIYADEDLLFGVFQNLLTNSIKFSSEIETSRIYIGSEVNEENRSIIYINDNGLGFDDKDSENIFIPRFRTELSSKFPGEGIGLATVQQIVNSHGGRIWAKGKPGEGATFYLYLPGE